MNFDGTLRKPNVQIHILDRERDTESSLLLKINAELAA